MDLQFTVSGRIDRPVATVYEAVVDPAQLSQYFTTGGAEGRLAAGATVTWDFHDFPGAFPVQVIEATAPTRLIFQWDAAEGAAEPDAHGAARTTVTMVFEAIDDGRRTLLRISETGWQPTTEGLRASYANCEGWTGMLCALRVWLEHGVRLRQGFYA